MSFKQIKSPLVLFCGWLVILGTVAAIIPHDLPDAVFRPFTLFIVVLFVLSIVAIFARFYKAWKRVVSVPNKAAYIVWLSFEPTVVVTAIAGIVWFCFLTPS
jgi:hypothetical protein